MFGSTPELRSTLFQPTLPAFTRSDMGRCTGAATARFQPTLPAFTRSDPSSPKPSRKRPVFQPTLPAFTRSDVPCPCFPSSTPVFQPTLPAFTRSDPGRARRVACRVSFNPRSPRSRGATKAAEVENADPKFQPTLPAFTRSNSRSWNSCWSWRSFNPRSPRSRGATPPWRSAPAPPNGFNPRSLRSRGATGIEHRGDLGLLVSTHAPRVHEERRRPHRSSSGLWLFQPTLPAFTRSDHVIMDGNDFKSVFQPTLPAFTRSDQPPPAPAQGVVVSTHAPRVHEERLTPDDADDWHNRFQPTLPAFTRSDTTSWRGCARGCRFNPRSPRSRGATLRRYAEATGQAKFQPTLPAFTRSDTKAHDAIRADFGFNPRSPRSRGATTRG